MLEGGYVVLAAPVVLAGAALVGRRRNSSVAEWTVIMAMAAWLLAVASVTLFPLPVQPEVIAEGRAFDPQGNNLIPFRFVADLIQGDPLLLRPVVANVAMFVPLGFLTGLFPTHGSAGRRALAAALAVSLGVEGAQFSISTVLGYTYRSADIDDVILNVAGALLGLALLWVIRVQLRPRAPNPR